MIGKAGQLPAGVVLVGGGAKLPGIVDLAKQELKLSAQIGIPDTAAWDVPSGELNLQIEDPEFACAAGLVSRGMERTALPARNPLKGNFWKKFINNLLP